VQYALGGESIWHYCWLIR